jgi:hypothetical protein
MNLGDIGSIASVIALVAMTVASGLNLIRKYKEYKKNREEKSIEFRDYLVSILSNSATASERSDAGAFIQQFLEIYRHKIVVSYIEIIIYLALASISFQVFSYIEVSTRAFIPLCAFVFMSLVNYWYITTLKRNIEKVEWDISFAWIDHIEKAKRRKENRKQT